ncbi:MAG: type 1 glutamine amidotransferase domain-containing protein [Candidatus Gastranaerophilales bacterium]|nr:type 1 glutamine amidotransferase domain-containing protein [Candidatus Gastranaerophilales bacterium]
MVKKVLIVTTNFSDINEDIKTGVYLEEFAVPYLVFKSTGYEITVASPLGGNSPIDESSLSCSNPMEWDEAAMFLRDTKKLQEVDYKSFDAIYLPGGHGPMFDLSKDKTLKEILEFMYKENKLIAAVCHGAAGLILAKDEKGNSILKNKHVTSFTNKEEQIVKMTEFMPFSLQTRLVELGADFVEEKPWKEHVEISGNIITGQNQNSALLVAESIVSLI